MSLQGKARLGAAAVVSALFGVGDMVIHSQRHGMGKEAFLAYQARMFDSLYAKAYPVPKSLVFGVLFAAVGLGIYELVARGLLVALRWRDSRRPEVAGPGGGA